MPSAHVSEMSGDVPQRSPFMKRLTGLLAVGFLLTGCGGPAATPSPTVTGGESTPAPTTCPAFVEPGCSSRPGLCRVLWTRRPTYIAYAGFTSPNQGVAITGPGTL